MKKDRRKITLKLELHIDIFPQKLRKNLEEANIELDFCKVHFHSADSIFIPITLVGTFYDFQKFWIFNSSEPLGRYLGKLFEFQTYSWDSEDYTWRNKIHFVSKKTSRTK